MEFQKSTPIWKTYEIKEMNMHKKYKIVLTIQYNNIKENKG